MVRIRKNIRHAEHYEQVTVINNFRNFLQFYGVGRSSSIPAEIEKTLIFAIPNGGKRNKREAIRLKKEGVLAGVPDLFIAVAKGKYHGLFVEMKSKNERAKVSNDQKEVMSNLIYHDYKCVVCFGAEQALLEIKKYLALGDELL